MAADVTHTLTDYVMDPHSINSMGLPMLKDETHMAILQAFFRDMLEGQHQQLIQSTEEQPDTEVFTQFVTLPSAIAYAAPSPSAEAAAASQSSSSPAAAAITDAAPEQSMAALVFGAMSPNVDGELMPGPKARVLGETDWGCCVTFAFGILKYAWVAPCTCVVFILTSHLSLCR